MADIFLKLAGIAGESQDAKHKGEIDVLAGSWGLAETQGGQDRREWSGRREA